MNELALFAGAGGGILGGKLLGWRTVCAVEISPYARSVLLARQADGCLDRFPIWDDIKTFDGCQWRGAVDVVSGGFPCQDISAAGKGRGIEGERSGLWSEMSRIIGEVQPRFAFVENSPMLTVRGIDRVLGDLAAMGYDARWGIIGAKDAGAPHSRERIWVVAYPAGKYVEKQKVVELFLQKRTKGKFGGASGVHADTILAPCWQTNQPRMAGMGNGMAGWVERSKCIGNGQVPAVAKLAWETLIEGLI